MDNRFAQERGTQVYTGSELILKGALEAGVSLLTGYPGSPVADFFSSGNNISQFLKERGIIMQIANNEALGAARINGAQMEDIRSIVVMKSVGAHVASDGLALGNISKASNKGGALVVIGDDPWSESTQVPTDSRFLSKHLQMPVMEPATFQELKDWVGIALDLSAKSNLYISYIVTTNLADGGGTVTVYANQNPKINTKRPVEIDTGRIPVEETVVLSPRTAVREETLAERYQALHRFAAMHGVNKVMNSEATERLGFVSSGIASTYLQHALHELGLAEKVKILKLGISYPLDEQLVQDFAQQVEQIVVIEEKRDFIESQVATIVKNLYQNGKIDRFVPVWGKIFPFDLKGIPSTRGLNPSLLISLLGPLLSKVLKDEPILDKNRIKVSLDLIEQTSKFELKVPPRTPTFCPGCPHRDSASVLLEVKRNFRNQDYMWRKFKKQPVDLVFHGDTGCYTMLMFEPNSELMHNYSGMGLGGGTGAGIDPFITNKQAVFMGDSTFFHSGMLAISDAIKHNQDITFIILDNGATAMTGHQPTPSQQYDIMGNKTIAQNIEEIIRGMVKGTNIPVYRTNPAYRTYYTDLLEELLISDGVKIVIADKECGITYDRKVSREERRIIREKGFLPEKMVINITPEVCENCRECTLATGCPGLTIEDTEYGPKIVTDLSLCKADTACTKIHACPSFEAITIHRSAPVPQNSVDAQEFMQLQAPTSESFDATWHAYLAGVGGMGIGLVTAILVQAGVREGYHVQFTDKKGLAIRNGGVYSHILFSKSQNNRLSGITPYGRANLLIGLDILEAARSIDPKMNLRVGSPLYTSALINTHRTPTVQMLLDGNRQQMNEFEEAIRRYTKTNRYYGADVSQLAEHYFGSKVFANIVMLGLAFQKGLLPLKLENLIWAIRQSMRPEVLEENLRAFNIGRLYASQPEKLTFVERETYESVLRKKESILEQEGRRGKSIAKQYTDLVVQTVAALRLDDDFNMQIAMRLYDLIQFENVAYARQYASLVKRVKEKDSASFGYEATKAVMKYLHKVMLIKDEVYVAHLLTSMEKWERDSKRYQVDVSRGDRLKYRHFNRPEFVFLGLKIRFHVTTFDWQLRLMRRLKWLRLVLPGWHKKEKQFRDWYIRLVENFSHEGKAQYRTYVEVLKLPEEVRGYREIRYPKMKRAVALAEQLLLSKNPPGYGRRSQAETISNI